MSMDVELYCMCRLSSGKASDVCWRSNMLIVRSIPCVSTCLICPLYVALNTVHLRPRTRTHTGAAATCLHPDQNTLASLRVLAFISRWVSFSLPPQSMLSVRANFPQVLANASAQAPQDIRCRLHLSHGPDLGAVFVFVSRSCFADGSMPTGEWIRHRG